MATDRASAARMPAPRVAVDEAMRHALADFADWLRPMLDKSVRGTYDLQITIDDRGRPTLRIRPGYLTISKPRV
jgi:hypothetical protein